MLGIAHAHKVKPPGIEGGGCGGTLSREEHVSYPIGLLAPHAHVYERAHDIAHHVLQKSVGGDFNADKIAPAPYDERLDRAHGRSGLTFGRTKTRKVVLAEKVSRSCLHFVCIA